MNYSFEEVTEDLSPCPMGSSHTKNTTCRVIQSYLDTLHGSVYSVDNLRFALKGTPKNYVKIVDALDRYDGGTDDFWTYTQGAKPGGYKMLWQWRYLAMCDNPKPNEKTSIALGWGLVKGNGKLDESTGFLEFNPSKVPYKGFEIMHFLETFDVRCELQKYDLAIDFPIKRDLLRVKKDGRKYACEISDSMTEYLGQRNKPGRVKVYDKAAERGYMGSLSRVELTCSYGWGVDTIMSQLPVVYNYSGDLAGSLQGVTLAYAVAVREIVESGQPLEPWLRLVNPKTRAKLRNVFSERFRLKYDEISIGSIIDDLKKYC